MSPAIALAGSQWSVDRVNGSSAEGFVRFDHDRFEAFFGCNRMGGNYRIDRNRLVAGAIEASQMYCAPAEDDAQVSPMDAEASAVHVLGDRPEIHRPASNRLVLRSTAGSIDLSRP